jgi:MFS family permease
MFIGNGVSFFGYQFTAVAVPVQVYALTRSNLWVGFVSFAGLLPLVIFSLWGGAVADALDRRKVLLVSSVLMWLTTLALLLQALLRLDRPWVILVLVALQSGAFAVSNPTRSAITPRLMPQHEVASAQTLSYTLGNVSTVAGPIVAGLIVARHDVAIAYAVDALAFTVALWAALRLPPLPPERAAQRSGGRLQDVREGLRFLSGAQVLLLTFAIDIAAMVLALPRALFPAIADDRFGQASLSWLYSSIAIGSVLAGLSSGWISRVRRQGVALIVAVFAWGLAVAAAGAVPWLWAVVLFLAVGGAADMISAVYRQTMLLTYAPDEMRGRLQGVFFAVVAGGPRLGDLRAGTMAQFTGTTVAWVAGGLAAAAVAALIGLCFPRLRRYRAPVGEPAVGEAVAGAVAVDGVSPEADRVATEADRVGPEADGVVPEVAREEARGGPG